MGEIKIDGVAYNDKEIDEISKPDPLLVARANTNWKSRVREMRSDALKLVKKIEHTTPDVPTLTPIIPKLKIQLLNKRLRQKFKRNMLGKDKDSS